MVCVEVIDVKSFAILHTRLDLVLISDWKSRFLFAKAEQVWQTQRCIIIDTKINFSI